MRLGKWKLVSRYPKDWELYDMETDRTELNNLAEKYPGEVANMSALYEAWARRRGCAPHQLPPIKRIIPAKGTADTAEQDDADLVMESNNEDNSRIFDYIKKNEFLFSREKGILISRYGFDDGREKTLAEIAEKEKVSRERIRQIESRALKNCTHQRPAVWKGGSFSIF